MGSDNDLLLAILTDAQDFVSHDFILSKARYLTGHGLTVHSRASDLRKQGHRVECDVRRVNGRALSYYRLIPASTWAEPDTRCLYAQRGEEARCNGGGYDGCACGPYKAAS